MVNFVHFSARLVLLVVGWRGLSQFTEHQSVISTPTRYQFLSSVGRFTPALDSVLLTYFHREWGERGASEAKRKHWPPAPDTVLLRGKSKRVDIDIPKLLNIRGIPYESEVVKRFDGIQPVIDYYDSQDPMGDRAAYWKDLNGTRLILYFEDSFHGGSGQLILSAVSKHRAGLVNKDWSGVKLSNGLRLGTKRSELIAEMGRPFRSIRFGTYRIMTYFSTPMRDAGASTSKRTYFHGTAAAFALSDDRIVEMWLSVWTTEPRP